MIKKLLIALVAIVGLFLIYVAFQKGDYVVSREIKIAASADKIFPYIDNAQKMNSWNPWMQLDPTAKITYTGPEAGVGAMTSWEGGDKLGTGSATIIESVKNERVKSRLDYTKPFVMSQEAEISLATGADKMTTVKWSVSGKSAYLQRVICFFMNMDKMVGETFEKGLSQLKTMMEAPAKPAK